jgi:hypothetical protein
MRPCHLALTFAALACAPARRDAAVAAPIETGLTPGGYAARCTTVDVDLDEDRLDDACELALARAFAPALVVDPRDCLWMPDATTPRLGGGYLFAAEPVPGGVRIAYMPAYFRDCGWTGAPCLLRGPGCAAHEGDSEIVIVDVAPAARDRWTTTGIFLSAHCFGRSDGRCRWYRGDALAAFTWVDGTVGGAPHVFVARGKHGGYPSRESCDGGHWGWDSCDGNDATFRFPVQSETQNVGSRRRPFPTAGGCVTSAELALGAARTADGARECAWDGTRPFRGWQAARTGSSPSSYARYLARFAAF